MSFNKHKTLERAEKYAAKGQHARAAREYRSLVDHDPTDIRAWLMLADCTVRSGQPKEAIEHYLQVARTYTSKRQPQKALAVFRQVLNLDPSRLDVLTAIAELNHHLGRVPDAVAAYEAVASAHLKAERVQEALKAYRKAADVDPGSVSRRLRLAELYSREKMNEEAVEAFRQAAQVLREGGRIPDFVRVCERLLFHQADDLPTLRAISQAYLDMGEPRRALMKLNTLLQKESKDPEGLELLASTFEALGRKEKAASVLVEVAKVLVKRGAEEHRDDLQRVVRRGLAWSPEHAELLRFVRDHGLEVDEGELEVEEIEEVEEVEALELDADDLEELEPDDLELEAPEPEEEPPAATSMTASVIADVQGDAGGASDEGTGDVDKVLHETRVYLKYKLYGHALEHLDAILESHPEHVGARSLRARALRESGRGAEAAEAYVEIAEAVAPTDPPLAQENLRAALELMPEHPRALELMTQLGGGAGSAPGGEAFGAGPQPSVDADAAPGFDAADESAFDGLMDDDDLSIDDDQEDEDVGGEGAGPQGIAVGGGETSEPTGINAGGEPPEGVASGLDDFAINVAEDGDAEEAPTEPIEVEDRFGLSDAGLLPEAGQGDGAQGDAADEPPPPAPAGGEASWPDVEDELAEIRFYASQGLDDDLAFALDDLDRRHPGHPQVAKLRAELAGQVSAPPEEAAAQPLVTFEDEDEDADAYLAAIFSSESSPETPADTPKRAGAHAEIEGADGQTLFDLGTAYREMGLVDQALEQFQQAAEDPAWEARARTMSGMLWVQVGQVDRAVDELRRAAEAATNEDELHEARYELARALEQGGDHSGAVELLQQVPAGFRDRDDRLRVLEEG